MTARRKPAKNRSSHAAKSITVRRVSPSGGYELAPPPSVARRAADLEEVHKMLAAGEIDVAEDELRWLVGGCPALLEGHKLLGRIAADDANWELARVHFAYAYQLGLDAMKTAGIRGP
ncbi:MAG TPA: hypothetical protein VJL29_16135, partial [Thermoguttaceae bacterium]|nr:hypothetical protein [Thermoguttaceae bacterium]